MVSIGKVNTLEVVKTVEFGVYLQGDSQEILLPRKSVPSKCKIGDKLQVFIYKDSEDRIIATTKMPKAQVGDFACLKVTDTNDMGAFLDWGLEKELFVPFREQKIPLEKDKFYTVYIYLDNLTQRIAASSKIKKFLDQGPFKGAVGDEVQAMVIYRTDIGFNCIINKSHIGILYENEVFQKVSQGDMLKAYVKKIREDGKIDLSLHKQGYEKIEGLPEKILAKLKKQGGFMPLHAKSDAEAIYAVFGVSKKTFKMAIGNLYKQRLISIEERGIRLV